MQSSMFLFGLLKDFAKSESSSALLVSSASTTCLKGSDTLMSLLIIFFCCPAELFWHLARRLISGHNIEQHRIRARASFGYAQDYCLEREGRLYTLASEATVRISTVSGCEITLQEISGVWIFLRFRRQFYNA